MWRLLIGTALVLGGAMRLGAPALAHFDATAQYSHRACPASAATRSDPVNAVFHGWGTWGRAASQVESHAGWTATSGSAQHFLDHNACAIQHAQRASGEASRFHLRIRGQHRDSSLGWAAAAAVHHEDLVLFPLPCGHAVDANGPSGSGFDQGRSALESAFVGGGHPTHRSWWGNTLSFKQCDGDFAASDGWVVVVALHQVSH